MFLRGGPDQGSMTTNWVCRCYPEPMRRNSAPVPGPRLRVAAHPQVAHTPARARRARLRTRCGSFVRCPDSASTSPGRTGRVLGLRIPPHRSEENLNRPHSRVRMRGSPAANAVSCARARLLSTIWKRSGPRCRSSRSVPRGADSEPGPRRRPRRPSPTSATRSAFHLISSDFDRRASCKGLVSLMGALGNRL